MASTGGEVPIATQELGALSARRDHLMMGGLILLFGYPAFERLRHFVEIRRSNRARKRLDALRIAAIQKHGNEYERTHEAVANDRLCENADRVLTRVFLTPLFANGFEEVHFPPWKRPPRVPGQVPPDVAAYSAKIKKLIPDAEVNPALGEATDKFPNGCPALEVVVFRESLPIIAYLQPKVEGTTP